ncbi:cobalt ECF transporter T component CbiQ [Natranaerobius thermophilus JW/NM-WN-LF]|uniref:Cobalt ABC transporter, inner membrane subunit CbiQ n=1 Tax=Natranaerobius thermophilus (strain ATCC BAA-1301 / DSM 18059 / JW/NM-WN-LF) TaxID=457570 RepID=B2A196_NATTJ|nr:cobalt ABC transporter, inner membrane subunit CbiQ [Natranaerobius thermophilus JW/NM-WN-LF]
MCSAKSSFSNQNQKNINNYHPWEPRTKLVAGVIFVFGTISLDNISLLSAALLFSVVFALCSGLNLRLLIKKLSILIPFLALMNIPLIFGAGFPLSMDRVEFAALISLRALTSMTFTLFVFINQPIEEMLEAMEHLKVPSVITTVIYLAYRYGFLFIKEIQINMTALKARLFTTRLNKYTLKTLGELAGGIFIKAIHHSEIVHQAMAARGFQGKIPVGKPEPIKKTDIIKTILPVLFMIFLIIIEQVVF